MTVGAARDSESCRHHGCPHPRTRFSVFCEEHHRRQLEKAGSGGHPLRPQDAWRLVAGPLWLNGVRVVTAIAATITMDFRSVATVMAAVGAVSTVIGWRRSRTVIWRPDLGHPIAYFPSPLFIVPIALYTFILMGLTCAVVLVALWAVG
jgi:hypothetical protein